MALLEAKDHDVVAVSLRGQAARAAEAGPDAAVDALLPFLRQVGETMRDRRAWDLHDVPGGHDVPTDAPEAWAAILIDAAARWDGRPVSPAPPQGLSIGLAAVDCLCSSVRRSTIFGRGRDQRATGLPRNRYGRSPSAPGDELDAQAVRVADLESALRVSSAASSRPGLKTNSTGPPSGWDGAARPGNAMFST